MGSKNRPFLLLPWPCMMPTLPTCFFSPFLLSSPWGCRKVGWGVGEHSNLAEICFRRKGSVIRRVVSSDTSEPYKLKLLKPRWQGLLLRDPVTSFFPKMLPLLWTWAHPDAQGRVLSSRISAEVRAWLGPCKSPRFRGETHSYTQPQFTNSSDPWV